MGNGINLSLAESQVDFDGLLIEAIAAVKSKKLSLDKKFVEPYSDKFWEYVNFEEGFDKAKSVKLSRYVKIENEGGETGLFCAGFIGVAWKKKQPCLWLEFDANTSPAEHWDKVNELAGTSGMYYANTDFEFSQAHRTAWARFYLKDELLRQLYNENAGRDTQMKILTGFITEVINKL